MLVVGKEKKRAALDRARERRLQRKNMRVKVEVKVCASDKMTVLSLYRLK